MRDNPFIPKHLTEMGTEGLEKVYWICVETLEKEDGTEDHPTVRDMLEAISIIQGELRRRGVDPGSLTP